LIRKSAFIALVALFVFGPAYAAWSADDQLPNLNQVAPRQVYVKEVRVAGSQRFRLGFDAATGNVGEGPLTIHGFRRDRGDDEMRVDQLVAQADGTSRQIRAVGVMRFIVHPDHNHWHFQGFARYELRAAGATKARARTDRKTGFCLGDRYRVRNASRLPNFAPFPAQADQCGLGQPTLSGLFSGISVGYGDRYGAFLEGQYIDVTGLPPGRYTLVHTANPDGALLESDYTDNSASVALRLSYPDGRRAAPAVKILARCQEKAVCP
jgi:hypothetical protein